MLLQGDRGVCDNDVNGAFTEYIRMFYLHFIENILINVSNKENTITENEKQLFIN